MTHAIRAEGLVKTFGKFRALDGLDLEVRAGEVHGFLGPNGAGKTTTIRILLGLVKASGGGSTVLGQDPWTHAAELHRRLAYVPGDVSLWPNLTGGEVIDLLGRLRGGSDPKRKARLIERFELDPARPCRTYSKGNRQKVAIIAALASEVELYLLDEPTSGLDPLMQAVFREAIAELRHEGRTVLLSSHVLAEVQSLCDRVSIIRRGHRIRTGAIDELRRLTRTRLTAETGKPVTGLDSIPGVSDLVIDGQRLSLQVESEALDPVLRVITAHGVRALDAEPPSLEDVFLTLYGEPAATSVLEATR